MEAEKPSGLKRAWGWIANASVLAWIGPIALKWVLVPVSAGTAWTIVHYAHLNGEPVWFVSVCILPRALLCLPFFVSEIRAGCRGVWARHHLRSVPRSP